MKKCLISLAAVFAFGAAHAQTATGVVQTISYGDGWAYVTLAGGGTFCPASGTEGNKAWFPITDPTYRDFRADALMSKFLNSSITYTVTNQTTWCRVTAWKWNLS